LTGHGRKGRIIPLASLTRHGRKSRIIPLASLTRERRRKTLLCEALAGVDSNDGHRYGHYQAADDQNCSSGKVQ